MNKVGLVLILAMLPLNIVAGDAPAATPLPAIAGETIITGTSSGYIDVRVPKPVSLDTSFDESNSLEVQGRRGALSGFAMIALNEEGDLAEISGCPGPTNGLMGGQLWQGAEVVDFVMGLNRWNLDAVQCYEERTTLQAGSYRLYLLANGSPTTVTIRFRGLTGKRVLRPTTTTRFVQERPRPVVDGTNLYSNGALYDSDRHRLSFHALMLITDPHLAGEFNFCYYDDPPQREIAFAPGCPLALAREGVNDRFYNLGKDRKLLLSNGPVGPGSFGQGVWFTTQSVVEDVKYVSAVLDL
ncbi:MAG: hypothetical protein H0U53_09600 [Actinobacteria bacterium]|nr:hypothetical protein [Actinomycetota bacterium]